MNTVSDYKGFSNWIKERNVSSTKNPEAQDDIDVSKSLIEKAAAGKGKAAGKRGRPSAAEKKDQSQSK